MTDKAPEYKLHVLTTRLKVPSVVETLTEQSPEVEDAVSRIEKNLRRDMAVMEEGWRIQSHSLSFYSGLVVATFLLVRE